MKKKTLPRKILHVKITAVWSSVHVSPGTQVIHRTKISNPKVYVLAARHHVNRIYSLSRPFCSHFIKQQNEMPNTFHNSAAFAYFPARFLGGAMSTLNSTHPDKDMGLCAFLWQSPAWRPGLPFLARSLYQSLSLLYTCYTYVCAHKAEDAELHRADTVLVPLTIWAFFFIHKYWETGSFLLYVQKILSLYLIISLARFPDT